MNIVPDAYVAAAGRPFPAQLRLRLITPKFFTIPLPKEVDSRSGPMDPDSSMTLADLLIKRGQELNRERQARRQGAERDQRQAHASAADEAGRARALRARQQGAERNERVVRSSNRDEARRVERMKEQEANFAATDPDIVAGLSNRKVREALQDPSKLEKLFRDPEFRPLIEKMMSAMGLDEWTKAEIAKEEQVHQELLRKAERERERELKEKAEKERQAALNLGLLVTAAKLERERRAQQREKEARAAREKVAREQAAREREAAVARQKAEQEAVTARRKADKEAMEAKLNDKELEKSTKRYLHLAKALVRNDLIDAAKRLVKSLKLIQSGASNKPWLGYWDLVPTSQTCDNPHLTNGDEIYRDLVFTLGQLTHGSTVDEMEATVVKIETIFAQNKIPGVWGVGCLYQTLPPQSELLDGGVKGT